jgi:hypothetical protein
LHAKHSQANHEIAGIAKLAGTYTMISADAMHHIKDPHARKTNPEKESKGGKIQPHTEC